jgi:HPt (histidine-containing phosphotransfer) domain-containing protein
MPEDSGLEDTLAALRREFGATLPTRLADLRQALGGLRQGVGAAAIQAFFLPAHSLQGTAGSYEAHELVPHVARLATLARRWLDAGAAPAVELDGADTELDALEAAIERYRERVGRG